MLSTCSGGVGILQGHIPTIIALEIDTIILKQRGIDNNVYLNIFVVTGKAIAEVYSNASGDTEIIIYAEQIFYINSKEDNSNKLKEKEDSNETKYGIKDIIFLKEELKIIENNIWRLEKLLYLFFDNDISNLKLRNINKSGSAYSLFLYNRMLIKSQYVSILVIVRDRVYKQVIYEKKLNKFYQKKRIIRAILKGIDLDCRN